MHKSIQDLVEAGQAQGKSYDWFDELYRQADHNVAAVPWAKLQPHPALVAWLQTHGVPTPGSTALVVGCGLGDDAEFIQQLGYITTAFDVATAAIAWCHDRFPRSSVSYAIGDLFTWSAQADLVLEHRTVQALPLALRSKAIAQICSFVAPNGLLIVVTNIRPEETPPAGPPWPLSPQELAQFHQGDLTLIDTIAIDEGQVMVVLKKG